MSPGGHKKGRVFNLPVTVLVSPNWGIIGLCKFFVLIQVRLDEAYKEMLESWSTGFVIYPVILVTGSVLIWSHRQLYVIPICSPKCQQLDLRKTGWKDLKIMRVWTINRDFLAVVCREDPVMWVSAGNTVTLIKLRLIIRVKLSLPDVSFLWGMSLCYSVSQLFVTWDACIIKCLFKNFMFIFVLKIKLFYDSQRMCLLSFMYSNNEFPRL